MSGASALAFLEAVLSAAKGALPPVALSFQDAPIDGVERILSAAGLSSALIDLDAIAARSAFCADALSELTRRENEADVLVLVANADPTSLPRRDFPETCRTMLLARVRQLAQSNRPMVLLTDAALMSGTPALADRFLNHF